MHSALLLILLFLSLTVTLYGIFKTCYFKRIERKIAANHLAKHVSRKANRHLRLSIVSFEFTCIWLGGVFLFAPAGYSGHVTEAKAQQVVMGRVGVHVADTMLLDQFYRITASISKSQCDSILFANLEGLDLNIKSIKITSRVSAWLLDPTAESFTISKLSTNEQIVDDSSNSVWRWLVKPLKGGSIDLVFRFTIRIEDERGSGQKDLCFIKTITIEAPLITRGRVFVKQHGQYLVATLAMPLLVWTVRKIRLRKKRGPIGFQRRGKS